MTEPMHLDVTEDVASALAELYWLFPFTRTAYAAGSTSKLVNVPLAPRAAPRRQVRSAAERVGHAIPDWVPALWCCNVRLGGYEEQSAAELGQYIAGVNEAAHAAGAPESIVFFAGGKTLYPGTMSSSAKGQEFRKGVLEGAAYGFEPSGASDGASVTMIRYHHNAKDPARKIDRLDLAAHLREKASDTRLYADDYDVFSKETYASILAVRAAKRPAFELRWETQTPGIAPPAPPPEPAPPPQPAAPVRVVHKKFGAGTVLSRDGTGDSEKLTVAFDAGETKTLLARFVQPQT